MKVYSIEEGMLTPEKVEILDLSGKEITEIDLDILAFDALKELILDDNPELAVLPEELEYLPNIQRLSLKACHVALVSQLKVFLNLNSLDCSRMNFDPSGYTAPGRDYKPQEAPKELMGLGSCTKLQELNLSGCKIWRLPNIFGSLTRLKSLSLDDNALEELPDDLAYLEDLEVISIKNNHLRTLPQGLVELPKLKELYAAGNELKKENARFQKRCEKDETFKTDYKWTPAAKEEPAKNLAPAVISQIERLGIKENTSVKIKDRYQSVDEAVWGFEELCIPASIVQLLWGYAWNKVQLQWRDEELYYLYDEDEAIDERDKPIFISDGFYMTDSNMPYFCIGTYERAGHPHRLSIKLKDMQITDPLVYTDDYENEPCERGILSELLSELDAVRN